MDEPRTGVVLSRLLPLLGQADVRVLSGAPDVVVSAVQLVDVDDLTDPAVTAGPADLWLLAAAGPADLTGWLGALPGQPPARRPRVALTRLVDPATLAALAGAARRAGVVLLAADPATRWESLLLGVRAVLDGAVGGRGGDGDTDLSGLAQTVARLSGGMVSIEDDRAQVLAYSASDEAADELRRLSILGRQGPAAYLRRLDEQGVYRRLRIGDAVQEVPADPALGIARRLVVGIHPLPATAAGRRGSAPGPTLGAIWVQEGATPLSPDTDAVLRGAAAVAARLLLRAAAAPSTDAVQIQRLLGAAGGGVDAPSLAAALGIPTAGPAVVVGLAADGSPPEVVAELAAALRLHASAFAAESLVTALGERVYVLFPAVRAEEAVTAWADRAVQRLAGRTAPALRAAVAAPVRRLADLPAARAEVDRVLHGTVGRHRVTTLADSRTPVLLGEILDLMAADPALADPRVTRLRRHDAETGGALASSLERYLAHFGDVRAAAAELSVHPNTLRYRVRRAADLLGMDLDEPAARLLVQLQLAMAGRLSPPQETLR